MSVRVKNWCIVKPPVPPMLAPLVPPVLHATECYGHDKIPEGGPVFTSPIIGVENGEIVTRSGTHYVLDGPPMEEFKRFIMENPVSPEVAADPLSMLIRSKIPELCN